MAMKRGNGTGTVYKKKDKPRKKPFVAVVTLGWDDKGRRIKKQLGTFATATEAGSALNAYTEDPTQYLAKDITFGQMWDMMIQQKTNLGISSVANYNMTKTRCTYIWDTPIQQLRLTHIQDIVDASGLSTASKRQMKVTLNAVFSLAYENDYIAKNYAELIKLPALGQSSKHFPFSSEDMRTMWQHTDDDIIKMALIYCYTGARPIELLEMPSANVYLSERYMEGGVKTAAGKDRRIPIAECIYPLVAHFYKKNAFGGKMLFDITAPTTFRLRLIKACEKYGMAKHIPHDGRHTFATMASNYRLNDVTVRLIVGHSRWRNTLKSVYTHKTQEQLLTAVNTLLYGLDMCVSPDEKGGATASI